MEPKMIIRFRNGSRKDTVVEFPLKLHPSIRFKLPCRSKISSARRFSELERL